MEKLDILSAVYSLFQHCQSRSASVEGRRKFFDASQISGQEQKLNVENMEHYIMLHFNTCCW